MDLPITPTFFKNIGVYQRLVDYDKELNIKPIWQAEKIVLLWSAGADHQHIGSYIDPSHIEKPLEDEVEGGGKLGERSAVYAVHRQEVLDALVVRGFATKNLNNKSVLINEEGFIAGKILKETNLLKNDCKYKVWIVVWWFVLGAAFLLLLTQLISSLLSTYDSIMSHLSQSQTIHSVYKDHLRFRHQLHFWR